ncbi:MAG: hypothetical protein JNM24_11755 [Bdellovibrionaceae bacterium]|jgi:acyl transferase domain-containing protein|nr:hypothetical protein [Pseudobdellovibrionaceae bacterium]
MKKILLFPGSDSIEIDSLRFVCGQIPEVIEELEYAQNLLQHAGVNVDLFAFTRNPKVASAKWFHELTLATIPVHVGLYKVFKKHFGQPDVILSCSLGDVSRNICIGATSYEESLLGMHDFAEVFTKMNSGLSIHATFSAGYQKQHLEALSKYDLAVSIYQTPLHLLIGGSLENAQRWADTEVGLSNVKLKALYPYPLHTILMTECYERIQERITQTKIEPWTHIQVYSAVEKKYLSQPDQLRAELKKNIVSAVHWNESLLALQEDLKDVHFYNMGPTPSLTYFHKKTLGDASPITDVFSELKAIYANKVQDGIVL